MNTQEHKSCMDAYLSKINSEVLRQTQGLLSMCDLADTVFFWDRYEDGVPAAEVAVELLENDTIGAALLAGVGAGIYSSVAEAAEAVVRIVEEIEPTPEQAEIYDQVYAVFQGLYPKLKDGFRELGAIADSTRSD